eukprot:30052-Pelagococcus_subviridis.AAC.5
MPSARRRRRRRRRRREEVKQRQTPRVFLAGAAAAMRVAVAVAVSRSDRARLTLPRRLVAAASVVVRELDDRRQRDVSEELRGEDGDRGRANPRNRERRRGVHRRTPRARPVPSLPRARQAVPALHFVHPGKLPAYS